MGETTGLQRGLIWAPELRIANPPPSLLVRYTRKEKEFFYDYASFILRIIQDGAVRERIGRILALENVQISGAVDVRVMVFPARTFRGQSNRMLHGSYNSTASQISLYPLRIPKEWIRNDGFDMFRQSYRNISERKRRLLNEISASVIATLLHEMFHVKLGTRGISRYGEEAIVRKMERQYMDGWEETISSAVQMALPVTSTG
jgi:hypothetical protein